MRRVLQHARFFFLQSPPSDGFEDLLRDFHNDYFADAAAPFARPLETWQLVRRVRTDLTHCGIPDAALASWQYVLRIESAAPLDAVAAQLAEALHPQRVVDVVVHARQYTSEVVEAHSYRNVVRRLPGDRMPNFVLIPLTKSAEWYAKDPLERAAFFLPQLDQRTGAALAPGHARAAEEGVAVIHRRSYHAPEPGGQFDFFTCFEFDDANAPVFDRVCRNLRDVALNPEWRYVQEGPEVWGVRVPSAAGEGCA